MSASRAILLRGVRVHNLQNVDLDLPLRKLIVMTGVSGSGKSSLAFDTLYAEGQRRFLETLSPYARQFFNQFDKPECDRLEHIPPAIAIRQSAVSRSGRSTVATTTELHNYFRLLFARAGQIVCPDCGHVVAPETPQTVADQLAQLPDGTRFQIGFRIHPTLERLRELLEQGFVRVILDGRLQMIAQLAGSAEIASGSSTAATRSLGSAAEPGVVIVDRLRAGRVDAERLVDSLETAFRTGDEQCVALCESPLPDRATRENGAGSERFAEDERSWHAYGFSGSLTCAGCGREFRSPEPRLFSFDSPLGACPECHGYGSIPGISFEKVVPDPELSLRAGAIAPWNTPAYQHELEELLALADDYGIPVDIPFRELSEASRRVILEGVPERDFGGLRGFFHWLHRHRYKMSVRTVLSRWRSYQTCPACDGTRLAPEARAVRIGSHSIADVMRMTVGAARAFQSELAELLTATQRDVLRPILSSIAQRLLYLERVGLEYLTLERTLRTLSGGEAHRVALTSALGSNLVHTLYVLDEPTAGLHPRDVDRLLECIEDLRDLGNTVIVVEHDAAVMRRADWLVDIGPQAGREGGRVVYAGTQEEFASSGTVTAEYFSGRRQVHRERAAARPECGAVQLRAAHLHNLKRLDAEFPLGCLCCVSGVSGSGKSSLVNETLVPALSRYLGLPCSMDRPPAVDAIHVSGELEDVILVTQDSLGRSSRSNPITYVKAFDEVRRLFAETPLARSRNYRPGTFSFNTARGGRCPRCEGQGTITIDMHFLADATMVCPDCEGRRYQHEVLDVKYRGLTIADVLELTVAEAFTFFRNQSQIQQRLQPLKAVGLDYLPLGQPTSSLSGGESQRLKLASYLGKATHARTLFVLDEPTVGLHKADVQTLLQCFEQLLAVGHSLVVVEHDVDVLLAADHLLELGPGAGDAGGRLVASGSVDELCGHPDSVTGAYLSAERDRHGAGSVFRRSPS